MPARKITVAVLLVWPFLTGCGSQKAPPPAQTSKMQMEHSLANVPGMSPGAKAAALKQLQQMQQQKR